MSKPINLEDMKPILFNTKMVKAILDGSKTQTRRVLKTKHPIDGIEHYNDRLKDKDYDWSGFSKEFRPKYKLGDVLYVRETWNECTLEQLLDSEPRNLINGRYIVYRADGEKVHPVYGKALWRPSIHMPKKYARIFLKVTDVRVERLQESFVGDADDIQYSCEQEGAPDSCYYPHDYSAWWENLWNSTAKDGYKWENNPYVFVYEFERVEK